MSSVAPVPPAPPASVRGGGSRHHRNLWKKLRRKRSLQRIVPSVALWVLTVTAVWLILKQIIK